MKQAASVLVLVAILAGSAWGQPFRRPTARITSPTNRLEVTSRAKVDFVVVVRSEIGVARVFLITRTLESEDPGDFRSSSRVSLPVRAGALEARLKHRLDLGELQVKPGARVEVKAKVFDQGQKEQFGISRTTVLIVSRPARVEGAIRDQTMLLRGSLVRAAQVQTRALKVSRAFSKAFGSQTPESATRTLRALERDQVRIAELLDGVAQDLRAIKRRRVNNGLTADQGMVLLTEVHTSLVALRSRAATRIVNSLGGLRSAQLNDATRAELERVTKLQDEVLLQLRALAARVSRYADFTDVVQRLRALVDAQQDISQGLKGAIRSDSDRGLDRVAVDQRNLRDALRRLDAQVRKLSDELTERQPARAERLAKVHRAIRERLLYDDVKQVLDHMESKSLLKALVHSEEVRDDLRALVRLLEAPDASAGDAKTKLYRMRQGLDEVIRIQTEVHERTSKIARAKNRRGSLSRSEKVQLRRLAKVEQSVRLRVNALQRRLAADGAVVLPNLLGAIGTDLQEIESRLTRFDPSAPTRVMQTEVLTRLRLVRLPIVEQLKVEGEPEPLSSLSLELGLLHRLQLAVNARITKLSAIKALELSKDQQRLLTRATSGQEEIRDLVTFLAKKAPASRARLLAVVVIQDEVAEHLVEADTGQYGAQERKHVAQARVRAGEATAALAKLRVDLKR